MALRTPISQEKLRGREEELTLLKRIFDTLAEHVIITDEKGEARFFVGIEPEVVKPKEELGEEFSSLVAHQLRGPLTVIAWTLEQLLRTGGLNSSQQNALEDTYKHNRLLLDLISDILVLSRTKESSTTEEEIDLGLELDSILEYLKKAHPEVAFSIEKMGYFPLVTSKHIASQVFLNLIANAAEYSAKDGGRVTITLKRENGEYLFSVGNNGLFIPAKDQPKIFRKFFRASNATEYKKYGTGLGLFIVKMICDHFGWYVSFQSPRPEGDSAIFFVRIPQAKEK
ncbi:hypothetical protein A3C33_02035 [Candidatus Curtissbacteria bacterium RIFCSPHIGHO2_02_FULL_42_58]|uniref:histidine kinase n=1 Tax=Candidatus Curtissbacteria bacterium RIFCSPLOWO2_01_FULL_42_50 TaxID=1797730 RepID=A0A1F5H2I6_9BACT|nr:MAG: hypothetical protein A3C33_02035 [Candidatus Curtissbacteria bacterium RIFCSPHIGHO2_02_FULL_42_58]OGD96573.1 MAG: hypothetical protein A3E71_02685 [Candidatus Curtissbacteria bacterium RIFCSPHIGHO2_12_FULL_42_33]OGD98274.1 MAG: hypothetical protein A3B54_04125 [Candidatus Curtissbacteria bacterium RIFCSPLOWO2_01_FULL_42_50]